MKTKLNALLHNKEIINLCVYENIIENNRNSISAKNLNNKYRFV